MPNELVDLTSQLFDDKNVYDIVLDYAHALRQNSTSSVDDFHSSFLLTYSAFLRNNDFINNQSKILGNFCKYISDNYPEVSFTFSGRIKSLIRLEEKFNRYICMCIEKEYKASKTFPEEEKIVDYLQRYRDIVAYRYVICIPKRFLALGENKEKKELVVLYNIANILPKYLRANNIDVKPFADLVETKSKKISKSQRLEAENRPYIKDYVSNPKISGYRSLHLAALDPTARSDFEIQLRTKSMDDFAEIGEADHSKYEEHQSTCNQSFAVPLGICQIFDDAYHRLQALEMLDLSTVNVNMFTAYDNSHINDKCGLICGRLISPIEKI